MTNRAYWLFLGASFTLLFAAFGWRGAVAAAFGSLSMLVIAFAHDNSQEAERVWIKLTLVGWALLALVATQPGVTPCGPDDPAGCYIRR